MLRLHFAREIAVPVGTLLVLRHQVYGYNAFNFYRCAGVRASDVTVYSAPGMGLAAINSSDLTLSHFNVCLRPNSGRLMSATADATHFGGCQGTVTLEDCLFEGMGDDGGNVKSGLYLIVRQRLDAQTVLGQHNLKMADFYESIGTRDVTVRHNLFENCNRGAAAAEASLAALAWLKDFAYPTKPGVHRDVTFEGNRFVGADGKAIFAVGVDGLTIRNNRIGPAIGPSTAGKTPDSIRVLNCARVVCEGRTID